MCLYQGYGLTGKGCYKLYGLFLFWNARIAVCPIGYAEPLTMEPASLFQLLFNINGALSSGEPLLMIRNPFLLLVVLYLPITTTEVQKRVNPSLGQGY